MLLGFGRLEKEELADAPDGSAEVSVTQAGAADPVASGAAATVPATPAPSGPAPMTGPPATANEM